MANTYVNDPAYQRWIAQLRVEFTQVGWQSYGESIDPRDPCWIEMYEDGLSPAEMCDEEIQAAGE